MACSVAQCLEVVGEWWSMLIIRDAFLGTRRFDDFQKSLGISRNVLTQRLSKLIATGVMQREPYQHNPVRYEYSLTPKGKDLWPVLTTMRQWGDQYAAPKGPPIEVVHRNCGHAAPAELRCTHCHKPFGYRDVSIRPGPGRGDSS